ncbi:MAG: pentapeptide repeat-containing protein [Nostoc sp.]|uniref:pentapeptide repeat-containing protein n=1 Tax=Nostoc sp. TaxID=1180 RepID=UPI002FF4909A
MSEKHEHILILEKGIEEWNKWRKKYPEIKPDLRGSDWSNKNFAQANFSEVDFREVDFFHTNLNDSFLMDANLSEAQLQRARLVESDLRYARLDGANLYQADCSGADFRNASFDGANLQQANFFNAKLCNAILINADLFEADLRNADLSGANLTGARLVRAKVQNSNLEGCRVYGTSVWDLVEQPKSQSNLIITRPNEITITVDNLKVAQFIHLLLINPEIREVIDTVAKKVVLILGRFTEERLVVLRAIKKELRKHNYLPILFDFDKPSSRNFKETVSTVAHLSRFIIADLTDPQAIPGELSNIIPVIEIPIVPIFQPVIDEKTGKVTHEWTMFWDFLEKPHVLDIYDYSNLDILLENFEKDILIPAEEEVEEISKMRQKNEQKRRDVHSSRTQKFKGDQ